MKWYLCFLCVLFITSAFGQIKFNSNLILLRDGELVVDTDVNISIKGVGFDEVGLEYFPGSLMIPDDLLNEFSDSDLDQSLIIELSCSKRKNAHYVKIEIPIKISYLQNKYCILNILDSCKRKARSGNPNYTISLPGFITAPLYND